MTKQATILGIFVLFLSSSIHAQKTPVKLRAINDKRESIGFVTFTVTSRLDSLLVIKQVADSNGVATFQLDQAQQYKVNTTGVNYMPLEKGIALTSDQATFTFQLESMGKTLAGVVVTSKKPLMRQEDDKTIVDPENLVASSTSGYEVIEKTPGLFVDQDGNIYISSMTPATIYINGREMKMSSADVATMLKSLPPNSIDKIEILRTPSAKYDASNSGGIVNVVLKKGVKIGKTGSVNGGWQQGTYANSFFGLNINNNDNGKSSFFNLNYSRREGYEKIVTDRLFAPDSILSQDAFTKYPSNVFFAGYGITFPVSKKWDIDFGTSASLNDFDNSTRNRNSLTRISTAQLITDNLNLVRNDGSSLNYRIGTEAKKKIDSLGSEWDNDLFYNYTRNKSEQFFNTVPVTPTSVGDGKNVNERHLVVLRSDLKIRMKNKFTFETGAKGSLLYYNSVANYFQQNGGVREKDFRRTNTFKYDENINSVYLQGSKTLGKDFVIKTGLRLENTNMTGNQLVPGDTTFSIHRTDLFPYIYLSKNLMKIAGYDLRAYLVYRRTITRPVYEQLNPFIRYVDQFLSETGNPALRPQFTSNYEANVSVDERPILAVGYNDTKDIFTNVIYQPDSTSSQAYRTYDNLGNNTEWYFRGLGAIPPGKTYFFVIGAQFNYVKYDGFYEKNSPLTFSKGTWTFFTYHTLKLGKRSMATMNGFIRLKGQQQLYELGSFGSLSASVNRKFAKDKLIVTLNISDIFATNKNDFKLNQGSVQASGYRQSDTRRVGINLRYNFGMKKKEESTNMFNVETP